MRELLHKHKFLIYVQMKDDRCVVTVPATFANPEIVASYLLKADGIEYSINVGGSGVVEAPIYAQRLYLSHVVASFAAMVSFDPSLIAFLDPTGEWQTDSLFAVVPGPVGKDDVAREEYLVDLIERAEAEGFPDKYDQLAQAHGVLEGYDLLKNL
jgi:hypothetical protein